jgi:hypothetical protein
MSPRTFINFFRSPMGALLLFVVLLGIVLTLIVNFRPKNTEASAAAPTSENDSPQTVKTVEREMVPFQIPAPVPKEPQETIHPEKEPPKQKNKPVIKIAPISLFQAKPQPQATWKPADSYAPFGRLIRCELIVTVDSSSLNTPIIGLVTDDVWHREKLIIPAGTEVHGVAQTDRSRERIASLASWTLVWKDGRELRLSGLALDREKNADSEGWAISDGSAGLRGQLLKSESLAEIKLFAATFLSGAAEALTDKEQTVFGSQTSPSLNNAPLQGAQDVLATYAQSILSTIQRDGFYVRVPAGKQFYLYITQTIDPTKATPGSTRQAEQSPIPTPPKS